MCHGAVKLPFVADVRATAVNTGSRPIRTFPWPSPSSRNRLRRRPKLASLPALRRRPQRRLRARRTASRPANHRFRPGWYRSISYPGILWMAHGAPARESCRCRTCPAACIRWWKRRPCCSPMAMTMRLFRCSNAPRSTILAARPNRCGPCCSTCAMRWDGWMPSRRMRWPTPNASNAPRRPGRHRPGAVPSPARPRSPCPAAYGRQSGVHHAGGAHVRQGGCGQAGSGAPAGRG